MKKAEKTTETSSSIVYVAAIAAGIKLFNLFLPNINMFKVINPSISIVLQGVAVYVLLSKSSKLSIPKAITAGGFWRVGILTVMVLTSASIQNIWYFRAPFRLINFIVFESIVNGVLIYLLFDKIELKRNQFNPNYSFIALFLALALQYVL